MMKGRSNVHEILMVQVMRTSEVLQYNIGLLLKEYDLTSPQYNILRILRGADEAISLNEVKERMLFDTSDVSRLVDRLVKKDLVSRNICPKNRRKLDVCISDAGLTVLEEVGINLEKAMDGFFKDLIPADKAVELTKVLVRMAKSKELEQLN